MANQDDGSQIAWFLAGMAIGLAGALLLAPRSGKETREALVDAAAKGRDVGRDLYEKGREMAAEATDAGKTAFSNLVSEHGEGEDAPAEA